jgi:hypothetical protein
MRRWSRFRHSNGRAIINAVLVITAIYASAPQPCMGGPAAENPTFQTDIRPILEKNCWVCHRGASAQAGLDMETRTSLLKGGKSGGAIQPGSSDRSLIVEKIASGVMPPGKDKLSGHDVALIRRWIDHGAPDGLTGENPGAAAPLVTEEDVLPIFQMRCVVCHGKRKQEGGLDLRTRSGCLKGGKSGPALVPGHPEDSLMLRRIAAGQMPPPNLLVEYFVRPPTSEEVDTLRKWIAAGAPVTPPEAESAAARTPQISERDKAFWSFQPPRNPAVPAVRHMALLHNPIDAFLLHKLESRDLSFSPEAEELKLLRRAYLDVTGLPPSPAEVEAYLKDTEPGAYDRLIDRLLASPHYGERWAQFWLDAAGYSDSEGIIDEDLVRPDAWRYRDYVIRSLNRDKPYDQFLIEQIAGDELVDYKRASTITPELIDKLAATGFLRMVPDGTYSPANGSVQERMNVIADEIEVLGSSVLGLTIGCARCHDHKYDPIPQRDYYRFSAILQTAYDPYDWRIPTERNLDLALETERRETAAYNAPFEAEIARLEAGLEKLAKPLRDKLLSQRFSGLSNGLRSDVEAAVKVAEGSRNPVQQYLVEKFAGLLKVTNEELAEKFPEFKSELDKERKAVAAAKKKLRPKPQIRALFDMGGDPSPCYLLRRGDAQLIGTRVQPGVPSILTPGLSTYRPSPPRDGTSGQRLALARWLVQPEHPLTARVIMNRLWMHHFGRGLVTSVANFGRTAAPPSHPELLDWLATEFVRSGWSLKAMHRLMLTSTAYRQSSLIDAPRRRADRDNALLSRMPLRRMDAEQLSDSILKVSGSLDSTAFGAPVPLETLPGGELTAQGAKQRWRRSIYTLHRRTTPPTMLEVFDLPPMTPNCVERSYSTVSTQALEMTNSAVVLNHARYLAGRIIDEQPASPERQIEQAYWRILSRRPSTEEIGQGVRSVAAMIRQWEDHLRSENHQAPLRSTAEWSALADFCHAMLSSAEFAYIE